MSKDKYTEDKDLGYKYIGEEFIDIASLPPVSRREFMKKTGGAIIVLFSLCDIFFEGCPIANTANVPRRMRTLTNKASNIRR